MLIPKHIKRIVDRIIKEYEKAYKSKEALYEKVLVGDKTYTGLETTRYFLEEVKSFRESLDEIFVGDEDKIKRNIWNQIDAYFNPLSVTTTSIILNKVICSGVLKKELKEAQNREDTAEDAKALLDLIKEGKYTCWGCEDAFVSKKIFKLVKSEEEFEDVLKHTKELTSGSDNPFKKIRVAFEEEHYDDQCRKKGVLRKRNALFKNSGINPEFSKDYDVFKFWNNIVKTGIYYVYIPK